jgi:ATP-dependent RNA helicase DeaD
LTGLVRSFFSSVTIDLDEVAAAARRERSERSEFPPDSRREAPEAELEESGDTLVESAEAEPQQGGEGRRRKRRRRGRGEGTSQAPAAEELEQVQELAPELEPEPEPALPEEPSPELENMVTLYFNVGKRDGLEAKDLAQLLTTNSDLGNDDIGRVRVKERHTFVGVPTERADSIISALEGQLVRNRALHVERART